MKKSIIIITLALIVFKGTAVFAASPSPKAIPSSSPTAKPLPVSSDTLEKAKELKEKVASKIAELKILQKRAVMGNIKTIADTYIIITNKTQDIKVETNTDTSVILSTAAKVRKAVKLSELPTNTMAVAWGQYNKEQETLTAKIILVRNFSLNTAGTVKSIDKDSVTITSRLDNKDYTIQTSQAKVRALKKDKTLTKGQVGDLKEGDFINIYATSKTVDSKTAYSALRITILSKSTLEDILNVPTATPSPSPTQSQTPKPSPKATPTPSPKS